MRERAEVRLLVVGGSHAYGTDRPDSDIDYRAVHQAPLRRVLGLADHEGTLDRQDPDCVSWEVGAFIRMAAKANPNVLDVLASPHVVFADEVGWRIRESADLFVSRKIARTFGGYALGQLRKAQAGTGGSRGVAHLRREKFAMHTLRLLETGERILRTGLLDVTVPDPDGLWERASRPLDDVVEDAKRLLRRIDAAAEASPLPERPDPDAVDRLLYELRMCATADRQARVPSAR